MRHRRTKLCTLDVGKGQDARWPGADPIGSSAKCIVPSRSRQLLPGPPRDASPATSYVLTRNFKSAQLSFKFHLVFKVKVFHSTSTHYSYPPP